MPLFSCFLILAPIEDPTPSETHYDAFEYLCQSLASEITAHAFLRINYACPPLEGNARKAAPELDNRKLRAMSDLEGERKTRDIPLDEQDVWTNPWPAELFVEWLRGGDPPPNNLDDNIQCAALLFAKKSQGSRTELRSHCKRLAAIESNNGALKQIRSIHSTIRTVPIGGGAS